MNEPEGSRGPTIAAHPRRPQCLFRTTRSLTGRRPVQPHVLDGYTEREPGAARRFSEHRSSSSSAPRTRRQMGCPDPQCEILPRHRRPLTRSALRRSTRLRLGNTAALYRASFAIASNHEWPDLWHAHLRIDEVHCKVVSPSTRLDAEADSP